MRAIHVSCIVIALLMTASAVAAPSPRGKDGAPAGDPATFKIVVSPSAVAAGSEAEIALQLVPAKGIKVNKYPKIKLQVPAQTGLVEAAEAAIGNDAPPPADQLEANYFKSIDPVKVKVRLDAGAAKGAHEIAGKLTYFYCVAASGFCAPARVAVKIPVTVR